MHEMSLARALVDAVIDAAGVDRALGDGLVREVHVRAGPMAGVTVQSLEFAFEVAARGTIAEGASLIVQKDPVIVRCDACGVTTEYETLAFDCGACGAPCTDVTAEPGLGLVRLVLGGRGD
jgi:hydrogenase nickel incorporation protein HypA/HybF